MPIPAITAELAVSIARGLIKLGGRIDNVVAEGLANNSDSAVPDFFRFSGREATHKLLTELENLAANTPVVAGQIDPLDGVREDIAGFIERRDDPDNAPSEAEIIPVVERLLPDLLIGSMITDGQRVERELNKLAGSWNLQDEDIRRASYYLGAGRSNLGGSLSFRLAMVVVDVLAEFTLDTQHLFVKDEAKGAIIKAILTRFSEGDLEDEISSSEILLRRLLSSTLNGALDARESWDGDDVWLNAALDALNDARSRTDADGNTIIDDDYLIGLLQGRGYRRLVGELIEESGELLSQQTASMYRAVLADVLVETAPLVRNSQGGFEDFFQQHWADLARAGLRSVSNNGPQLLDDANPVIKVSLISITRSLSETQGRELFSTEALTEATEAAIAAVAANPSIMGDENTQITWTKALFSSFAAVVADRGLQASFSPNGLEGMARHTAKIIAQNPELIVDDPGLPRTVVAGMLHKIAGARDLRMESLATSAVDGALSAIADNPALLKSKYADVLGDIAGSLAAHVRDQRITGLQAQHLISAASSGLAANPELFGQLQERLAQAAIEKVIEVAGNDNKGILAGSALSEVAATVVSILAARGNELLTGSSVEELANKVGNVLQRALAEASHQLGRRVDVPSASLAISMVMETWARGDIAPEVFDADAFEAFFAELADFARDHYELPVPAVG